MYETARERMVDVMLEQKDLEVLQNMMETVIDKRITESEKNMEAMVDKRTAESEKNMEAMMDKRIAESEKNMEAMIDKRIAGSEKNMETMMDRKVTESENLILKEMDRVQINLTNKINEVQKNLDELNQYYRITKLENDNTALLLKMIDELSKRVEVLEKKTA